MEQNNALSAVLSAMIGKKYGKLTVLRYSHKKSSVNYFECRCDCGNTTVVRSAFLKSGLVKSCGCPVEPEEEKPFKIKIGQKVQFDPFFSVTGFASDDFRGDYVTGEVIYVNEPHHWFSVEYGDPKARTSFKFCDIGGAVELLE